MSVFRPISDLAQLILLVGSLSVGPLAVQAADLPRVVSMNLCTDQLVLLLADPEQIVSLSRLATDARSSSLAEQAKAYPQNSGGAEEIFLSAPDILLAGTYSDKTTLAILRGLGLRVEQFPITSALDQIPQQIRQMGEILQQQSKADARAAEVETYLANVAVPDSTAPVAAFYYPNGYSLGANTLGHDIISAAGFRNLTKELGMTGSGTLDLEQLVVQAPDVLIASPRYPGGSRSEEIMFHPAIAHYARDKKLIYSSADWVCGTPITLRAVKDVIRARDAIIHQEKNQ